ncbi:MAG: hypothetical protein JSS55_02050 [Proteobacteria bacterium]|nr:hypothetical protein [Pseudomonadota bacterium]
MKQMTTFMIALALTLVCDRSFNHGGLTLKLFDSAGGVRDWAVRSGDEVATSVTGFTRS